MTIEERWPSPHCGNRRRVRWGQNEYFCFNCNWQTPFTEGELARLKVYRAAVNAGVYSDEIAARSAGMGHPAHPC
jgi:hypothetical protein